MFPAISKATAVINPASGNTTGIDPQPNAGKHQQALNPDN
jgi:hypothetical protein